MEQWANKYTDVSSNTEQKEQPSLPLPIGDYASLLNPKQTFRALHSVSSALEKTLSPDTPSYIPDIQDFTFLNAVDDLNIFIRNNKETTNRAAGLFALVQESLWNKETVNFVISSLQDCSEQVQMQALKLLQYPFQLDHKQTKKILSNIDTENKNPKFIKTVSETLRILSQRSYSWRYTADLPQVLMMPGTFDPIHNGHLHLALDAATSCEKEIWVVPNVVLKEGKNPLPIEARLQFIRKAIADQPNIFLPPISLFKDGDTWVDKKKEKHYLLQPHAVIEGWLRGSDVLKRTHYKDPESDYRTIPHVIGARNNDVEEVVQTLQEWGLDHWKVIHSRFVVSSGEIKTLIQQGCDEEALQNVPALVAQEFRQNGWYRKG
jgi:cytidyltransferase-like protein